MSRKPISVDAQLADKMKEIRELRSAEQTERVRARVYRDLAVAVFAQS